MDEKKQSKSDSFALALQSGFAAKKEGNDQWRTGHTLHPFRLTPREGLNGYLNTYTIGALYEAFEPTEAWRLSRRMEIHYTPEHGSWLNIAEIELSLLTRRTLHRRIESFETLATETSAWAARRNDEHGKEPTKPGSSSCTCIRKLAASNIQCDGALAAEQFFGVDYGLCNVGHWSA